MAPLLVLWAVVLVVLPVTGVPVHTCQLKLVGVPGVLALKEAQLICTPKDPPLQVRVNATYSQQRKWVFSGVEVSKGCGKGTALLEFCLEGRVHLLKPVVQDVYFPGAAQQDRSVPCDSKKAWLSEIISFRSNSSRGHAIISRGTLHSNTASFIVFGKGQTTVFLDDTTLSGNQCRAAVITSGKLGQVLVKQSRFINNTIPSDCALGGALQCYKGELRVEHSLFLNNTAYAGSGLSVHAGANGTVQHSQFVENYADLYAGAAADGSVLSIVNSTFTNNTALQGGGAGAIDQARLTINNCSFRNNTAKEESGGSLYVTDAVLNVSSSKFVASYAKRGGGGCYIRSSSATITSSTFHGNNATTGGGIYVVAGDTQANVHMHNCTITSNVAVSSGGQNNDASDAGMGGGVCIASRARFSVTDSNISHNLAFLSGGGLLALNSSVILSNCAVLGNKAYAKGGGLFCLQNAILGLAGGSVSSNEADQGGGLALWFASRASVNGTVFSSNMASSLGGAIILDVSRYSNYTVMSERWGKERKALVLNYTFDMCGDKLLFEGNTADGGGSDLMSGPGYNVTLCGRPLDPRTNKKGLNKGGRTVVWNRVTYDSCFPGEFLAVNDSGYCQQCPPSTYLLSGDRPDVCKTCNASSMDCPGGQVIVARSGFWNHPAKFGLCPSCSIDHMRRCPNPLACKHDHRHQGLPRAYQVAVELNSTGNKVEAEREWRQYTAQLCGGEHHDNFAYHGVLCGSCSKGYGSTSPFSCTKCPHDKVAIGLFVVNVLVAVVFAAVISLSSYRSNLSPPADDDQLKAVDVLKVMALYFQYARILAYDLHINWWPPPLSRVFEQIGGGSTSKSDDDGLTGFIRLAAPVPVDCVLAALGWDLGGHRAGLKALLSLLVPLALFVIVVGIQALWWFWRSRGLQPLPGLCESLLSRWPAASRSAWRKKIKEWSTTHPLPSIPGYMIVVALAVMFSYFTGIVRLAVASVTCPSTCPAVVPAGTHGCLWWALDMALACPFRPFVLPQGGWALGVGLPAWLCVAAVPLTAAAIMVWGSHNKLEGSKQQGAQQPRSFMPDFRAKFGFCFAETNYQWCLDAISRPRTSWMPASWLKAHLVLGWHAFTYLQMFLLTCISVAGALLHEYHQLLLLTTALMLYLLLIVWLRPFRCKGLLRLQGLMLAVLCTTCLCVMAFVVPSGGELQDLSVARVVVGWFVLTVNVLFVGLALALAILCFTKNVRWGKLCGCWGRSASLQKGGSASLQSKASRQGLGP